MLLFLIGFLLIIIIKNSTITISHSNNICDIKNPLLIEKEGNDVYDYNLKTNAIILENRERISSTGLNSSHTRVLYYPENKKVTISWIDLVRPFTPTADSSIYFTIGSESIPWSTPSIVESVGDTLTKGYNPTPDMNESIHFIFEEFSVDNYDLQEIIIEDGTSIQPKTAFTSNSGNSTNPVTIFDNEGIVHLVWRDTTDNSEGDLYYTNYNASSDTWITPIVRITTEAKIISESPPAIVVDENNTLHMIWSDNRTGDQELYYAYLEEGGSWSAEVKITNLAYKPLNPVIAYNNMSKNLEVLFRDKETTTNLWYITGKAKSSGIWSSPIDLTKILADQSDYDICIDQYGNAIAVYEIYSNDNNLVYLKEKLYESNWEFESKRVSYQNTPAHDPSITVNENGTYYIVFSELYQNTFEVYVVNGYIDTDEDHISDYDELNIYFTNPNLIDTDGDSLTDGDEILVYGTNPLNSDSDSDGMPDDYEIIYNFDPNDDTDAELDFDEDGLTNLEEFTEGTNPLLFDSDGDTIGDGDEINIYSTDPLKSDTDEDGLIDGYEIMWGLNPLVPDDIQADPDGDGLTTEFESTIWTDPTNPDTDGDGFNDGVEYQNGTDPLDPDDFPTNLGSSKDYSKLIFGILIGTGTVALFLVLSLLIAQTFRPKKATKRKELEREHSELFVTQKEKGRKMEWEEKEKQKMDAAVKKRFVEILSPDSNLNVRQSEALEKALESAPSKKEPIYEPPKKAEIDPNILTTKKAEIKKTLEILKDYDAQLVELLEKKMTEHTLLTASREGLTEFATESQRLYSEAKTLWNSSILPIIKGYEESLLVDTLEAEKIIDNCEIYSNKILDVLVQRELEFTEDEARKEDVKDKARKALTHLETDSESKEKIDEEIKESLEESSSNSDDEEIEL